MVISSFGPSGKLTVGPYRQRFNHGSVLSCHPEPPPAARRDGSVCWPDHAPEGDVMPRISYPDLSKIDDPEILGYLEHARRHGTPRPESQAIRSHNQNVIRAFSQAWDPTFRNESSITSSRSCAG